MSFSLYQANHVFKSITLISLITTALCNIDFKLKYVGDSFKGEATVADNILVISNSSFPPVDFRLLNSSGGVLSYKDSKRNVGYASDIEDTVEFDSNSGLGQPFFSVDEDKNILIWYTGDGKFYVAGDGSIGIHDAFDSTLVSLVVESTNGTTNSTTKSVGSSLTATESASTGSTSETDSSTLSGSRGDSAISRATSTEESSSSKAKSSASVSAVSLSAASASLSAKCSKADGMKDTVAAGVLMIAAAGLLA